MDSLSLWERAGVRGLLGCTKTLSLTLSHGEREELRYTLIRMDTAELIQEIIATYQRHGWQLRRVLLQPETQTALAAPDGVFESASIHEAEIDALWFARPSHAGREAWELRLIAEQRYALFEAFEADESEEDREEARIEMENKMRAQTA